MSSTRLVAARVPAAVADVLDAAAFVRRQSMQKLLAPALEALADSLARDSAVQDALAARRVADATTENKVSPMPKRRSS